MACPFWLRQGILTGGSAKIKLYINWFRAVLGWEELKAFGLLMKSGNIELISSMIGCSINGR